MWHLESIPKIAHFYWGNDSISYFRYLTVYSFKKYNPDWRIRLYYPKHKYQGEKTWSTPEHSCKFTGADYINSLYNLNIERVEFDFVNHGIKESIPETFKADFLRWHMLSTWGGLWSDFDIIYFKPMDNLYLNEPGNRYLDTLISLNDGPEVYHSIGFLLGSMNNPYYKFITSQTYGMLDTGNYQSIGSGILNHYFPNLMTIRERFPGLNIENVASDVVYPINYAMVPYIYHTPYMYYLTNRSIGLHWFAGHPESSKFENTITDQNHTGYNNIISQIIRMVTWQ